jgi:uncharacterized protein HemX
MNGKFFTTIGKRGAPAVALSLLVAAGGAGPTLAQNETGTTGARSQQMANQGKFACDAKALTPTERAHHKQLTEKLLAARKAIVETEKGYEFQYSPSTVSIAELADWVVAEVKCCPFLDFHIDLEQEGKLACLRLTGPEGTKAFIRPEFRAPAK